MTARLKSFSLNRFSRLLAIALTLVLPAGSLAQTASPTIDGNIDQQEWAGAERHALAGGGELLLLKSGSELFVAVKGGARGLASLCIGDKEQVEVLHASAALGTAVYRRHDRSWVRSEGFAWEARDRAAPADQLATERERFLADHQWIANASSAESPNREFRIQLTPTRRQLGVAFLHTADMRAAHWPANVLEGCIETELLRGDAPKLLKLNPWRWHEVK